MKAAVPGGRVALVTPRPTSYLGSMADKSHGNRLQITAPRFDFRKLVLAHGWAFLPPFEWDDERSHLARLLHLESGRHVSVVISAVASDSRSVVTVRAASGHGFAPKERQETRAKVRRMLRLDEDFSEFHRACEADAALKFVAKEQCGGLLRAPSAFEDLVKTICTTNCGWRNTKKMCAALCELAGGSFPEPEHLLRFSRRQLTEVAPVGYRAETILEAAKLCAGGWLDLDAWAAAGDFQRVREALDGIKGVGPYCVSHMFVLLGDYSEIPVDSEVLKYLRRTHFGGKAASPAEAVRPYDGYGSFRFLAFKFARMGRKPNYLGRRLGDGLR